MGDSTCGALAENGTATVMPAEWEPHDRTWMAWPVPNDTFGPAGSGSLSRARRALLSVELPAVPKVSFGTG